MLPQHSPSGPVASQGADPQFQTEDLKLGTVEQIGEDVSDVVVGSNTDNRDVSVLYFLLDVMIA